MIFRIRQFKENNMNKFEHDLMSNYLEQLSCRADSTIKELQFLQKQVGVITSLMKTRALPEQTRAQIPSSNIERYIKKDINPTDLIKIKEVMKMTGLSRSFIYFHKKNGDFPESISLGSRSVAWVRSSIDEWVLEKINNN
jgi:prophage regulatory protein